MMGSIDHIESNILEMSSAEDRVVKGIWNVDCLYNPANNGRVFDLNFLVSQTIGQGCAYNPNSKCEKSELIGLIGHDFINHLVTDFALKVSLLDSLYGTYFPPKSKRTETNHHDSYTKLKWRTQLIYDESLRLVGKKKNINVINIGVVGDILSKFHNNGFNIIGSDFDKTIIGSNSFKDIKIINGSDTLSILKEMDLAIITGMTITTNTIDEILYCCRNNNVKTIVFAETGANLASYYLSNGVDVYLSEYFPFYIYNGTTVIDVCYAT